eukprot:2489346-Prymnesium_polylepis.1
MWRAIGRVPWRCRTLEGCVGVLCAVGGGAVGGPCLGDVERGFLAVVDVSLELAPADEQHEGRLAVVEHQSAAEGLVEGGQVAHERLERSVQRAQPLRRTAHGTDRPNELRARARVGAWARHMRVRACGSGWCWGAVVGGRAHAGQSVWQRASLWRRAAAERVPPATQSEAR